MRKTLLALSLFISFSFSSCEKDDICAAATATTPSLTIDFLDLANQSSTKNVFKFRAKGIGNANVLDGYNIVTASSVKLPLKTDATETKYELYNNYEVNNNGTTNDTTDDFITGNPDIITIKYTPKSIFVSEACGFKTIFTNLTITVENDSDNWIKLLESTTTNPLTIENENSTHFNLFH